MATRWQPLLHRAESYPRVFTERVWRSIGWALLVRGLDQRTIERLKERARLNGRSLQQAVKEILERTAGTLTIPEARRLAEQWSRRLRGRSFSDSAHLIREDRDSR